LNRESSMLEAIHREIKSVSERLDFIEDLVEEVIVRDLPKAKLSRKELAEIKRAIGEMKRGQSVTLEELSNA
jgi:hypothetical protein